MRIYYFLGTVVLMQVAAHAQFYNNAFKIESSSNDRGMRIITDNTGDVITTGYFSGSADFDPSTIGTASLTPNGGSTEDVYLAKYDAALTYKWAIKFGGSGSDFPYAIATDASNNIIVGGDVSTANRDGFVNKYDPNGNLTWSIPLGGANKDVVYGVQTDAARNVYVTGYFSSTVDFDPSASTYTLASNGGRDIFLAKYDSAGNFRWAFNAGGTISTAYEEGGQDIAIAGANIYLTGNFEGTADFNPAIGVNSLTSNGSLDIFVASYDTAGNYNWAINMGSNNKHDYSYGIDLDASENVYITGGFEEKVDFDPSASVDTLVSASVNAQDIYVAKYNSLGAYQWAFRVGGNTSVDDHAFDIDVTAAGDIYITGEVWGPADFDPSAGVANINTSNDQLFFARYTNAGNFVWAFEVGATGSNGPADNGFGVHLAGNGTLYATGDFSGTADFDPNAGTATLSVNNVGHAFVASYGPSVSGINGTVPDGFSVSAFPNPACNEINFDVRSITNKDWNLEIMDVSGQTILKEKNIQIPNFKVRTEDILPGLYFYRVQTENKTFTGKLIME